MAPNRNSKAAAAQRVKKRREARKFAANSDGSSTMDESPTADENASSVDNPEPAAPPAVTGNPTSTPDTEPSAPEGAPAIPPPAPVPMPSAHPGVPQGGPADTNNRDQTHGIDKSGQIPKSARSSGRGSPLQPTAETLDEGRKVYELLEWMKPFILGYIRSGNIIAPLQWKWLGLPLEYGPDYFTGCMMEMMWEQEGENAIDALKALALGFGEFEKRQREEEEKKKQREEDERFKREEADEKRRKKRDKVREQKKARKAARAQQQAVEQPNDPTGEVAPRTASDGPPPERSEADDEPSPSGTTGNDIPSRQYPRRRSQPLSAITEQHPSPDDGEEEAKQEDHDPRHAPAAAQPPTTTFPPSARRYPTLILRPHLLPGPSSSNNKTPEKLILRPTPPLTLPRPLQCNFTSLTAGKRCTLTTDLFQCHYAPHCVPDHGCLTPNCNGGDCYGCGGLSPENHIQLHLGSCRGAINDAFATAVDGSGYVYKLNEDRLFFPQDGGGAVPGTEFVERDWAILGGRRGNAGERNQSERRGNVEERNGEGERGDDQKEDEKTKEHRVKETSGEGNLASPKEAEKPPQSQDSEEDARQEKQNESEQASKEQARQERKQTKKAKSKRRRDRARNKREQEKKIAEEEEGKKQREKEEQEEAVRRRRRDEQEQWTADYRKRQEEIEEDQQDTSSPDTFPDDNDSIPSLPLPSAAAESQAPAPLSNPLTMDPSYGPHLHPPGTCDYPSCNVTDDLWTCLRCGSVFCYGDSVGHAELHWLEMGHTRCEEFLWAEGQGQRRRLWDWEGDRWI